MYINEINVINNRINLRIRNVDPVVVLNELAEKGGFSIKITGSASQKSMTTEFRNLTIEEAIQRLMALIHVRNYSIFYNEDGSIKRIDIVFTAPSQDKIDTQIPPQVIPPGTPPQGIPKRPGRTLIQPSPNLQDEDIVEDEEEKDIAPSEKRR